MVNEHTGKTYHDRLDRMGVFALDNRRLSSNIIAALEISKDPIEVKSEDMFVHCMESRTNSTGMALWNERSGLELRV